MNNGQIRGDGVGAFVTALQADEDRRRGSDRYS